MRRLHRLVLPPEQSLPALTNRQARSQNAMGGFRGRVFAFHAGSFFERVRGITPLIPSAMRRILSIVVVFVACSLGLRAQVSTSWISRYSGPTNTPEFARALAVDSAGNAYVTGVQSPDGTPNMVTIKYGPTGNQVWVNIYGESGLFEYPTDINVDATGNVYVYGTTGTVSQSDLVLFKYNSAGVQQ